MFERPYITYHHSSNTDCREQYGLWSWINLPSPTEAKLVEEGRLAYRKVIAFYDWIFSAIHLNLSDDADADSRTDRSSSNPSYNWNIYYSCTVNVRKLTSLTNET